MDIKKYRPLFNVFVVDPSQERRIALSQILGDVGYLTENSFDSGERALKAVAATPPHVVIYVLADDPTPREILRDGQFLKDLLELVPESHVILACNSEEFDYGLAFYEKGAFDVLGLPLEGELQLINAVDRAIRIDYYNYLNEQLKEDQIGTRKVKGDLIHLTKLYQWGRKLHKLNSFAEVVPLLCGELHRHSEGKDVLFFKYIESQGTLVASYSIGRSFEEVRGLGVDLLAEGREFFRDQLFLPASITPLKELIEDVFGVNDYCAHSFVQLGTVKGVVVTLGTSQDFAADEYVKFVFGMAEKHVASIERVKSLRRIENRDSETKFLLRSAFLDDIRLEVSRARRIQLPVSLLVFELNIQTESGKPLANSDHQVVIKMVATIFNDNCRAYDKKGRMGENQLALLLPHVDRKNGAIKAERLRRVLESANYQEIVSSVKSVTVCVGVSEYPSLSSDPDDMLLTSDEALSLVTGGEKGRVCLASAKESFVPDFYVIEI